MNVCQMANFIIILKNATFLVTCRNLQNLAVCTWESLPLFHVSSVLFLHQWAPVSPETSSRTANGPGILIHMEMLITKYFLT